MAFELVPESTDLSEYMAQDPYVDYGHASIVELVRDLYRVGDAKPAMVDKAYRFVRDGILHSWDIRSSRVTRSASEVLRYREGICYAKANLLAALLRSAGVPTGFCYQRLMMADTPQDGYCIHALNAVFLNGKWVRLDARGNAQQHASGGVLAFTVRTESGEVDYPTIHAKPLRVTMEILDAYGDCLESVMNNLPSTI